jgi:hypothetical protein
LKEIAGRIDKAKDYGGGIESVDDLIRAELVKEGGVRSRDFHR